MDKSDIIVIGGGHAGVEAAAAAAKMGCNVLLVTHKTSTIGQMSCNPAIGGIGKSHLVREVDALGGLMAQAADAAGIPFRTLNLTKGPAVRATRAQTDRILYKRAIKNFLRKTPNLKILEAAVEDLIIKKQKIKGVITSCGKNIKAERVVLTTGTFLGGSCTQDSNKNQGEGRATRPAPC